MRTETGIRIDHHTFDDTELSEQSNWKEAHENLGSDETIWGGVSLDKALKAGEKMLTNAAKIAD